MGGESIPDKILTHFHVNNVFLDLKDLGWGDFFFKTFHKIQCTISYHFTGIPSPYARFATGVKMGVASPETVFLFNYRGPSDMLSKLVLLSGRKEDGGQSKDGVRTLYNLLKDALASHNITSLRIPQKAMIRLTSKYIFK